MTQGKTKRAGTALGLLAAGALSLSGCSNSESADSRSGSAASADAAPQAKFNTNQFLCVQPGTTLVDGSVNDEADAARGGLVEEPPTSVDTALDLADVPVTYNGQINAFLTVNCVGCHKAGATAPDLSSYALAKAQGAGSLAEIESGDMPPTGALSADKKALFQAWSDGGFLQSASGAASSASGAGAASPAASGSAAGAAPAAAGSGSGTLCAVPASSTTGSAGDNAPVTAPAPAPASTPPASAPAGSSPAPGSTTTTHLTNYTDDIKAVLTASCTGCHKPGATAPDLTTYQTAKAVGGFIASTVSGGTMPPAGPLSAATQALIKAWSVAGYPEKGN